MTPGTLLHHRFELLAPVGSGGVATVWRVRDEQTQSLCALKVLHPHLREDSVTCERFRREVQIGRTVRHPGIVSAEALFEDAAALSFSMPLLEGRTLKQAILAEGPLPVAEVLRIAKACLDALAAAHAAGVIHRDLKPQNVFVCSSGEVRLLDFGFARVANAAGLTTKSLLLCTPDYAAPELVAGTSPDGRADLYALGVILFEALTGNLPFRGTTPFELLKQHLDKQAPDIRTKRPDVSSSLARAVARLLAKAPEQRFATCESAAAALAETDGGLTPIATPPTGGCPACGGKRSPDWPLCPSCGATPAGDEKSDWMVVLVRAPPRGAGVLREIVRSLGGRPRSALQRESPSVVARLPRVVVKGVGEPMALLFRERCQAAGLQVELRRFKENNTDLLHQSNTPGYLFLVGLVVPWAVLLWMTVLSLVDQPMGHLRWFSVLGVALGGPLLAAWVAKNVHRVLPSLAALAPSRPTFHLPARLVADYRRALATVKSPALRGTMSSGWERLLVLRSAAHGAAPHVQLLLAEPMDAAQALAETALRFAEAAQDALDRISAAGEAELWASVEQLRARLATVGETERAGIEELLVQKEKALEEVAALERAHLVAAHGLLRVTSALELAAAQGLTAGLREADSVSVQLRRLEEEASFAVRTAKELAPR